MEENRHTTYDVLFYSPWGSCALANSEQRSLVRKNVHLQWTWMRRWIRIFLPHKYTSKVHVIKKSYALSRQGRECSVIWSQHKLFWGYGHHATDNSVSPLKWWTKSNFDKVYFLHLRILPTSAKIVCILIWADHSILGLKIN